MDGRTCRRRCLSLAPEAVRRHAPGVFDHALPAGGGGPGLEGTAGAPASLRDASDGPPGCRDHFWPGISLEPVTGVEPATSHYKRFPRAPRCLPEAPSSCILYACRRGGGAGGARTRRVAWESHRPDRQPPCSSVSGVTGGRGHCAATGAPLMPGGGAHIVVERVGGSAVSGGRERSCVEVVVAWASRTPPGALLHAPGARSGWGGRRAEGPERGAPRSEVGRGARAEGALEPVRKVFTGRMAVNPRSHLSFVAAL